MRRRFRLMVSGACALVAALVCGVYGQHVRDEAERVRTEALERYGGEVVSLLVAPNGLEAGEVVDRQNVVERDWLADLAPEGAVVGIDAVLGEEVTVPAAGSPLTELNFRDSEDAIDVPSGRVALSIPVTEDLGLPSSAAEGTTLAAYEVTDSGVSLLAADLTVLRAPGEHASVGSRGAVTLSVSPDSVASILASSAEGSLRLALPADDAEGLETGAEVVRPEAGAEQGVPAAEAEAPGEEGDAA